MKKRFIIIALFVFLLNIGVAKAFIKEDLTPNTLVIGERVFDLNEYLVTEEDYTNALLEYIAKNNYADSVPVYYIGANNEEEYYVEYMDLEDPYYVDEEDYEFIEINKDTMNENVLFNMIDFLDERMSYLPNDYGKYINHKYTIKSGSLNKEYLIYDANETDNNKYSEVYSMVYRFVGGLDFSFNGEPYILSLKLDNYELQLPWIKDSEIDWYMLDRDKLEEDILALLNGMKYGDLENGLTFEIVYKDFVTKEEGTYKITVVFEEYKVADAIIEINSNLERLNEYKDNEETLNELNKIGFENVTYNSETHTIKFSIKNPNMLLTANDPEKIDPLDNILFTMISTLPYGIKVEFDGKEYIINAEEETDQSEEFLLKFYSYLLGKEMNADNIGEETDRLLNDLLKIKPLEYTVTYGINGEEDSASYKIEFVEGSEMIPYEDKVEDTTEETESEKQEEIPEDNKEEETEEVEEQEKDEKGSE